MRSGDVVRQSSSLPLSRVVLNPPSIKCMDREPGDGTGEFRWGLSTGIEKRVRPVIDDAQSVGCDQQRAGTPNHRHGVPALPLVTPNHRHGVPALPLVTPYIFTNQVCAWASVLKKLSS